MINFVKAIFSGAELVGTLNLISGIIMALLWSYFASNWWSVALGFLALFFLIEAVWHYILADYLQYFNGKRDKD